MEVIKDELTVVDDDLILRGSRIVVQQAVDNAHVGHQGIIKTKAVLREKVWFAGIDKMVEATAKDCLACQVATPTSSRKPLQMTPLPDGPWAGLSADFGQLHNGQYILVVTDEYSRSVIVDTLTSFTTNSVILKLDKIFFSEYGIAIVLKTDNGPPFNIQ